MNSIILSLLIFIPVIGSIAMLVVAKAGIDGREDLYKKIALAATGLQLLLSGILYFKFDPLLSIMESPFTVQVDWISYFNIQYFIGVDGLSMPMVMLTGLLSFICIISSWKIDRQPLGYFSLFLLLDAGMMGVFLSMDFFLFYIFFVLSSTLPIIL